MVRVAAVLRVNGIPQVAAARADAISASPCIIPCTPTGPRITGAGYFTPKNKKVYMRHEISLSYQPMVPTKEGDLVHVLNCQSGTLCLIRQDMIIQILRTERSRTVQSLSILGMILYLSNAARFALFVRDIPADPCTYAKAPSLSIPIPIFS